jgi:glycerophosphoryl diester phosphodiesterase
VSRSARPLVIAHRGASGYRPEHTRAAYELAVELGADALEPDVVATADGVLVVRHENEISRTTDVSKHPEFAGRKTTKVVDGRAVTGWFTEDFTWPELTRLRAYERLPDIRKESSSFDGQERILRLSDLRAIIDSESDRQGRQLLMVAELKHATYFESIGLPLDDLFADEMSAWATRDNLIIESFEESILSKVRRRGIAGRLTFLAESTGSPADLIASHGSKAKTYAELLAPRALGALADVVDGVSVDKRMLLQPGGAGARLVDSAHEANLEVFCWSLRAENKFLSKPFRRGPNPAEYGDWMGEFQLLYRTGLDGVFADQPDLALEAIGVGAS